MADASLQERKNEQQNGDDYVNSLARGLEVIRAFTRSKPRMTLSEVAERPT